MTNAVQNFKALAAELVATAPTQKAADFANGLIAKIEVRGDEWITANAAALKCTLPIIDKLEYTVGANRIYFTTAFQMALVK